MRAARIASCIALSLVVIPACSDDVSTPVAASWLEWGDSVTAGIPFGVRVYGEIAGNPASLRIRVRVDRDTVTIEPYSTEPPCRGTCPGTLYGYDTLVWVPAMSATAPRTVTIRAPTSWHVVDGPFPLRTFGTLTVSPDTVVQPLMRSVGLGIGFERAVGCFVVSPRNVGRLYVSADQPPPWAPGFSGFVYGRIDPVLRSVCLDDAYLIQVDSIAL